MRIKEYVEKYGSDFLYILYNGHIAEYDSIKQNKSIKNNLDEVVFDIKKVYRFKISGIGKQEIVLINTENISNGYFSLTWEKDFYSPSEKLNRYRYWDRINSDGSRCRKDDKK